MNAKATAAGIDPWYASPVATPLTDRSGQTDDQRIAARTAPAEAQPTQCALTTRQSASAGGTSCAAAIWARALREGARRQRQPPRLRGGQGQAWPIPRVLLTELEGFDQGLNVARFTRVTSRVVPLVSLAAGVPERERGGPCGICGTKDNN